MMDAGLKTVHVTNFFPRPVVGGGMQREEALASFLADRGAVRLTVQDELFGQDETGKLMRLPRLMKEIRSVRPDVIVLNYPSFPFFWQFKVTPYYMMSHIFARSVRAWTRVGGTRVVVDVADLPLYQYEDLGFPVEMGEERLRDFDSIVFTSADEIWVCSRSLAETIRRDYPLVGAEVKVVVNGGITPNVPKPDRTDRPFRFTYCGTLDSHRGAQDMVRSFVDSDIPNAELHLAGQDGEWISGSVSDPRVVVHGSRTIKVAAGLTAKCDVGLIYYPQKGYYHKAFATKLSHYVCCGVPVLCTDVRETGEAVREMGVGVVADINDYASAMREMASDPHLRETYKHALSNARRQLTWESLYSTALAELEMAI